MSYIIIENNIFSIFDAVAWKNEAIVTIPANYVGRDLPTEYIRISIIVNGIGFNARSKAGILVADLFTEAGKGPKRSFILSDKLDSYLSNKVINIPPGKSIQFGSSVVTLVGKDADNPSLFRMNYTIPFNYYEVQ